jgi:hypothetical protein
LARWGPHWRGVAEALRSGWGPAALAALAVIAVVYVLNVLLAWLQTEAAQRLFAAAGQGAQYQSAGPGIAKTALISQMSWHAVSFDVQVSIPQNEFVPLGSFRISATFALMLGLATAGYLLYRVGIRVAERGAASSWLAGIHGLQIALVYGLGMFVLGLFAGVDLSLQELAPARESGEGIFLRPSLMGSFGMPFLVAFFAAGAGALRGKVSPASYSARMVLAAVSGGWRAAWLAVALSSVGFLIVAALHPDATRAFLELIPGGGLSRALVVVGILLVLPNLGTGIAAASMGGSINATSFTALGDTCALISYMSFPSGMSEFSGVGPPPDCGIPVDLGTAPLPYFLFLLVPLAATIVGGRLAAQGAGSVGARAGAVAGLTIALPYALWLWVLALIARAGYSADAGFFDLHIWFGPGLVSTVLVALLWGAAGGAIGGALGARNASGPGMIPGPPTNVSG